MRALVVFDKFKDSMTAAEACRRAATGLNDRYDLDLCPLADGGEGFASILTQAAGGTLRTVRVTAPRGGHVDATYGIVDGAAVPAPALRRLQFPSAPTRIAVIEMAQASGLALLAPEERNPWETTTEGTGQLIAHAAAEGADGILLGIGGSATNDLGLGALTALGIIPLARADEAILPPTPKRWRDIRQFAGNAARQIGPIRIACDVTNPLLGPNGCTAIYGPQKGLSAADLPRLERESERIAALLCAYLGRPLSLCSVPGAGAAGGIAFGLMAALHAELLPGFDLVADWLNLEQRLQAADIVITGEGRFDESSLQGKGPGAIAVRALELRKPVHVFAGEARVSDRAGLAVHTITPDGTPLPRALAEGGANLEDAVRRALG